MSEKHKEEFHVTVDQALQLIDYICSSVNVCHSKGIGKKLTELLYAKIYQMDEIVFEEYFNVNKFWYEHVNTYLYSDKRPNYWEGLCCEETGWDWCRVTGPSEVEELNRSGVVTYDCELFTNSYGVYSEIASGRDGRTYDDLESGDDVTENLKEMVFFGGNCSIDEEDWDAVLSVDKEEYARLVVCGARYIDIVLSGKQPDGALLERLNALHLKVFPGHIISGVKYFDMFFEDIKKYGFEGDCLDVVLPFLMDVHFGLKFDSETESTPLLYIFKSNSMKEYKDLRQLHPYHRYVPYLDKLVTLLEDPVAIKKFAESESIYETEVLGMLYSEEFASYYGYLSDSYLGVYYFYDTSYLDKDGFAFSPFFEISRQLFEFIFLEMKNDVAVMVA